MLKFVKSLGIWLNYQMGFENFVSFDTDEAIAPVELQPVTPEISEQKSVEKADVIAESCPKICRIILKRAMKKIHCEQKLRVPMLGATSTRTAPADLLDLSVAILGWATALLRSHQARAGDRIVLAADLDSRAGCRSVTSWDANSGKSLEVLRHRLEALPLSPSWGIRRRPRA